MGFEHRTSNIEHPTLNIEVVRLFLTRFCSGDTGDKDANQLVGFVENMGECVLAREKVGFLNELEPSLGFAKFFQCHSHLVDEVGG